MGNWEKQDGMADEAIEEHAKRNSRGMNIVSFTGGAKAKTWSDLC